MSDFFVYQGRQPERPSDTLAHALNITMSTKDWQPGDGPQIRANHKASDVAMICELREEEPPAYAAIVLYRPSLSGYGPTPMAALSAMAERISAQLTEKRRELAELLQVVDQVGGLLAAAGVDITEEGK